MSLIVYPSLIPPLERYQDIATRAQPLQITLRLRPGSQIGGYDPVHLDNLLAWAVMHEATQGQGLPPSACLYALPVPLACLWKNADGLPLWASSCFHPAGDSVPDTQYYHKRAISGRWSAGNAKTGKFSIDTARGRDMERRIPVPGDGCPVWQAWAWGDGAEIVRLLSRVAYVGKRRGAGSGEVLGWDVDVAPEMTAWTDAICRDEKLLRPVPVKSADALGLTIAEPPTLMGWTPPYWRPAVQEAAWAPGAEVGKL